MKKCNHAAYDTCSLEERCPSFEEAFFLEGSECEKHNQKHHFTHMIPSNAAKFIRLHMTKSDIHWMNKPGIWAALTLAVDILELMTAGKVSHVVRCQDCVHRVKGVRPGCHGRPPDFFCADGYPRAWVYREERSNEDGR